MNVNPNATTILCFGDSNTYGTKPDRSGRYDADTRWTGLLQKQLGDDFYVIEEGLGGRTTDLDHYNPSKQGRNGLTYFKACLESHMPLQSIIIMLGTNDFKTVYNRSAEQSAQVLKQYVDYIHEFCEKKGYQVPTIILVGPSHIDNTASKFINSMPEAGIYDQTSVEKSHELPAHIRQLAEGTNCQFVDAAVFLRVGDDGLHIDEASHRQLADTLAALFTR